MDTEVSMEELSLVLSQNNVAYDQARLSEIYNMLDLELIEDAVAVSNNSAVKLEVVKEQLVELDVIKE